jgi:Zn-dependent peptidase ImmA (M78 family)
MPRIEALITPSVIQWARKQAKFSIVEAARKIQRPVDDIQDWENGSLRPSIPQARKAAQVYRRPLAVFYLPEPPIEFSTLRDFRVLPDNAIREYSPELSLLIRTTTYRQEWTREYLLEEEIDPLPFAGSFSITSAPREVASDILRVLEITPKDQQKCSSRNEALHLWLKKAELVGIFIFRKRQIDLKEARGFVLSDDIAPFIFINSDDSKAAQIFTLVHELAHIWINLSGVSNMEYQGTAIDKDSSHVEYFCNQVAAEAVLEESSFLREWNNQNPTQSIEDRINQISGIFNISEEVVARRLLEREIISQKKYAELREFYQGRWFEFKRDEIKKMKSSKSFPSYYTTTVSSNGYAFTQTVVGAYVGGALSGRDASSLLNVKINNLHRIGETAGVFAKVE